jgi:hypothetical protein
MYNPATMPNTLYFLIALAVVLFLTIAVLGGFMYSLHKRLKRLTTGTNSKNLEDAIYQLMDDHSIFQNRVERIEETTGRIDSELKNSVRGIATVRYNAFTDVGGKQSFATALISEDGTGVVISSIYTRDRMNVYAKPIIAFSSEYELSSEESRALKEASKIFN